MKRLILLLSILSLPKNKTIKYCDIKGSVNNPGVYEIKKDYTIKDIIDKSGGLTNDSYTDNINLSKKVTDEMVIYISNKNEINYLKSLNNCNCSPIYEYKNCDIVSTTIKTTIPTTISTTKLNSTTLTTKNTTTKTITSNKTTTTEISNKLININTCTVNDLINIKGLGEKKANKIIEYRETYGLFNSINEIMNVSGIGETLFTQIKDCIEV